MVFLLFWSFIGALWWMMAWYLTSERFIAYPANDREDQGGFLSVFKPLPLLGEQELRFEAEGLESFIRQLDERSELLLGAHEADRETVSLFIERMQHRYPQAQIQVIYHGQVEASSNPKIAWQKILVNYAAGDLWLWSDADIVVPQDFLRAARNEFTRCGARMITFPYAIREVDAYPALFDALFVNVEFLPGVLLLKRFGRVDFGLGAAMLFRKDDFLRLVDWKQLDRSLADDFVLGQLLKPVAIGSTIVSTRTDSREWLSALGHYLRWVKTIRWCRPLGYAAQICILPMVGWIFYIGLHPTAGWAWVGLLAMMQIDVFFARKIFSRINCPLRSGYWVMLEVWSLYRAVAWILCWLPFPVMWRKQTWWRAEMQHEDCSLDMANSK